MRISSRPIITARAKCSSIGQIANSGNGGKRKPRTDVDSQPTKAAQVSLSPAEDLRLLKEKKLSGLGVPVGALAILRAESDDKIPLYKYAEPKNDYQNVYVQRLGSSSETGDIYIKVFGKEEPILLREKVPIEVLVKKGYYKPPQALGIQSPTIQSREAQKRIEGRKLAAPEGYKQRAKASTTVYTS